MACARFSSKAILVLAVTASLSPLSRAADAGRASICVIALRASVAERPPGLKVGESLRLQPGYGVEECAPVAPGSHLITLDVPEDRKTQWMTTKLTEGETRSLVVCKASEYTGAPGWHIVLASRTFECDR
jgi:hypothetical protein